MLRDLVSPARAPVVVAIALVRTFARVVPAAVAVSASTVAIVVSIPTKRLVVRSAGSAVTVTSAPVTAAAAVAVASITVSTTITATAVVATAAAATKPTSWSSRTSRGAVRWAIAVRTLVADATTAPAESVSTSTTAAEASSEASTIAASEAPSATSSATKATSKATAASKTTRASRGAAEPSGTTGTTTWARSRALGVASATKTASVAARAPARDCTTSLDIDQHTAVLDLGSVCFLVGGLHVLLAFVDNKRIATLLLLWWCVGRGSGVFHDADTLNGTVTAEFALKVVRGHVVREARDEQGLEGVALYFGVLAGFVCAGALARGQGE